MNPTCISFFLFTHTYGGVCAQLFEPPERRGDSLLRLLPLLVLPYHGVEVVWWWFGGGGGRGGSGGRSRERSGGRSGGQSGGGHGGRFFHYHATRLQKQMMFNEAPF